MSWQTSSAVTIGSRHKGSNLLVMMMLSNYADPTGNSIYPSMARLARDCRMSVRGVQYVISKLKASKELVEVSEPGPMGVKKYFIDHALLRGGAKIAGGAKDGGEGVQSDDKGGEELFTQAVIEQSKEHPKEVEMVFEAWRSRGLKGSLLTKQRRDKIATRLKSEFWRSNWKKGIGIIAESAFCRGQNDRGWAATLEWFTRSDEPLAKALDGAYSMAGAATARPAAAISTGSVWQGDIWLICDELRKGDPFDANYIRRKLVKAFTYATKVEVLDYFAAHLGDRSDIYQKIHALALDIVPGAGRIAA